MECLERGNRARLVIPVISELGSTRAIYLLGSGNCRLRAPSRDLPYWLIARSIFLTLASLSLCFFFSSSPSRVIHFVLSVLPPSNQLARRHPLSLTAKLIKSDPFFSDPGLTLSFLSKITPSLRFIVIFRPRSFAEEQDYRSLPLSDQWSLIHRALATISL